MNLKIGLFISILIGIVIAAFPLYSDRLAPYIWSYSSTGEEESENVKVISGVIENIDIAALSITVDGKSIRVSGTWLDTSTNEELNSTTLLELLQPGYHVKVSYTEKGRWGSMAEEITVNELGKTFTRT
ncbi:MAG: hypothetical protein GSR73_06975 [Desulfurococcales archaeon]|nr:hypothetical protein [Desulfurococcales archaeon]